MNNTFEKEYSAVKSRYHNAQKHLASMETKYRQQLKKVDSLRRQLEAEEPILQHRVEKYESAKEHLNQCREVYRPLKQQWKLLNPKGEKQ
jgi:uncharacterized protein involved in exopolysaccharide biosynthesis